MSSLYDALHSEEDAIIALEKELIRKKGIVNTLKLLIDERESILRIKLVFDELLLDDKIEQIQQMIRALNGSIVNHIQLFEKIEMELQYFQSLLPLINRSILQIENILKKDIWSEYTQEYVPLADILSLAIDLKSSYCINLNVLKSTLNDIKDKVFLQICNEDDSSIGVSRSDGSDSIAKDAHIEVISDIIELVCKGHISQNQRLIDKYDSQLIEMRIISMRENLCNGGKFFNEIDVKCASDILFNILYCIVSDCGMHKYSTIIAIFRYFSEYMFILNIDKMTEIINYMSLMLSRSILNMTSKEVTDILDILLFNKKCIYKRLWEEKIVQNFKPSLTDEYFYLKAISADLDIDYKAFISKKRYNALQSIDIIRKANWYCRRSIFTICKAIEDFAKLSDAPIQQSTTIIVLFNPRFRQHIGAFLGR